MNPLQVGVTWLYNKYNKNAVKNIQNYLKYVE
jgi:hypothetical protein